MECGSSCFVFRTSCSRTNSATHIASGTSETSSSSKRKGDSGIAGFRSDSEWSAEVPASSFEPVARGPTRPPTSLRAHRRPRPPRRGRVTRASRSSDLTVNGVRKFLLRLSNQLLADQLGHPHRFGHIGDLVLLEEEG